MSSSRRLELSSQSLNVKSRVSVFPKENKVISKLQELALRVVPYTNPIYLEEYLSKRPTVGISQNLQ